MSNRNLRLFLRDMLISIQKIQRFVGEKSYGEFIDDEILVDGVIRNLEVIGEAVKNIPLDVRERYPNIEWKKIAGLRDMLIHQYFGIDREILWDIIKNKIPDLKEQVETILSERADK